MRTRDWFAGLLIVLAAQYFGVNERRVVAQDSGAAFPDRRWAMAGDSPYYVDCTSGLSVARYPCRVYRDVGDGIPMDFIAEVSDVMVASPFEDSDCGDFGFGSLQGVSAVGTDGTTVRKCIGNDGSTVYLLKHSEEQAALAVVFPGGHYGQTVMERDLEADRLLKSFDPLPLTWPLNHGRVCGCDVRNVSWLLEFSTAWDCEGRQSVRAQDANGVRLSVWCGSPLDAGSADAVRLSIFGTRFLCGRSQDPEVDGAICDHNGSSSVCLAIKGSRPDTPFLAAEVLRAEECLFGRPLSEWAVGGGGTLLVLTVASLLLWLRTRRPDNVRRSGEEEEKIGPG